MGKANSRRHHGAKTDKGSLVFSQCMVLFVTNNNNNEKKKKKKKKKKQLERKKERKNERKKTTLEVSKTRP